MDLQMVKAKIQEQYPGKYPDDKVQLVLDKVNNFDLQLRTEFENFLETGEITTREIEGYTVERLNKEHGMNEIAAFLTLSWLTRDPIKARASLEKGHDFITNKT